MKETRLLMCGLPEAGKTTFLAAMWYLGTSGSDETSFTVKHLNGDLAYLNSLARAWLQCTPLPRTKVRESNIAELVVTDVVSAEIAHLIVPDLSGEIFQDGIASRRWDIRAARIAGHIACGAGRQNEPGCDMAST